MSFYLFGVLSALSLTLHFSESSGTWLFQCDDTCLVKSSVNSYILITLINLTIIHVVYSYFAHSQFS